MTVRVNSLYLRIRIARVGLAGCMLATAWSGMAAEGIATPEDPLARHISPGLWQLDYVRKGQFKPLMLNKSDQGTSDLCIASNPREQIVAWLTRKGCTVSGETLNAGRFQLKGTCRLKWWKSHPIPTEMTLDFAAPTRFSLGLRSVNDPMLEYVEQATAIWQGPCEAKAAVLSSPARTE